MMWNDGYVFHGGGFMWLLWVILIVGLVVVVFNLTNRGTNNTSKDNESALDILKKRYARGEIDEEEYERRHKKLTGN